VVISATAIEPVQTGTRQRRLGSLPFGNSRRVESRTPRKTTKTSESYSAAHGTSP
jgi:hypothetical protein